MSTRRPAGLPVLAAWSPPVHAPVCPPATNSSPHAPTARRRPRQAPAVGHQHHRQRHHRRQLPPGARAVCRRPPRLAAPRLVPLLRLRHAHHPRGHRRRLAHARAARWAAGALHGVSCGDAWTAPCNSFTVAVPRPTRSPPSPLASLPPAGTPLLTARRQTAAGAACVAPVQARSFNAHQKPASHAVEPGSACSTPDAADGAADSQRQLAPPLCTALATILSCSKDLAVPFQQLSLKQLAGPAAASPLAAPATAPAAAAPPHKLQARLAARLRAAVGRLSCLAPAVVKP